MILQPRLFYRFLKWKLIHFMPRHDVMIDTLNGSLTCDSKDWLIGKYLYVYREYEIDNMRETVDLLVSDGYLSGRGDGIVIDVGANIGMICIALLKQDQFKRAIAFEPDPTNFRLLEKNVAQNGLEGRIDCFPYALSSTEDEAFLELSPHNSGDNHIAQGKTCTAFDEDTWRAVKIRKRTLDKVLAGDDMGPLREKVSLIWLDIQGHEGYFFQGARQTLASGIPVASEFWPYGIKRSGMSRVEYCRVVKETFTHFYRLHEGSHQKRPITEIEELFEAYETPGKFCQIILINELE